MSIARMKNDDFLERDRITAIRFCELMGEDPHEIVHFTNPYGLNRVEGPRWMSHMRRVWSHRAMNQALEQ